MKRLLQQGHWVEETERVYVNIYDISTPEQAKKIGLAAFQLYLKKFYKNKKENYPHKGEYTLEMHKKRWTWRGGEERTPSTEYAWKNFENRKKEEEKESSEFYEALTAFEAGDGEKLIQFIKKIDDVDLIFSVVEVKDEFDMNPRGDKDEDEEDDEDEE